MMHRAKLVLRECMEKTGLTSNGAERENINELQEC
jgi:hypothetical protein